MSEEINAQEFFEAFYPDGPGENFLEIRKLPPPVVQVFSSSIGEAVSAAKDDTRNGYFGVALRRDKVGVETHVASIPALWCDLDWKDYDGDQKHAASVIQGFEFQPSIIVRSGGGWHLYWLLKEAEEVNPDSRKRLRGTMLGLARALGGDEACRDLGRILRVPNSMNLKNPKKPIRVEVSLWEPDRRFNLSDFDEYFIEDAPSSWGAVGVPTDDEALTRLAGGIAEGEGRNEAAFTVALKLSAQGMSREEVLAFMTAWNLSNRPPLLSDELQQVVISAHSRASKNGKPSSSPYIYDDRDDGPVTFNPVPFLKILAEAPEVQWQVENLIPRGTSVILGAEPGKGKSWMEMDLAVAVATGTPWLGRFETKKGSVLVIDEENNVSDLRRRGLKLLSGRNLSEKGDLPIEYLVSSGLNFSDPRHVGGLDVLLGDRKPDLVIIDSLVRVHDGEENSATAMAMVFREVKRLMDAHRCVFFFTHHSRKLGMYNQAGQMLRGSSEIKAFVDSLFFLKQVGWVLRVEHEKARSGNEIPDFIIEITDPPDTPDTTTVLYVGGAQADTQDRQEEAEQFIFEVLGEGRISRQELLKRAKEAKFSESTIDRALKPLVGTGQLVRDQPKKEVFFELKISSSRSSTIYRDDDNGLDGGEGTEVADLQEVGL